MLILGLNLLNREFREFHELKSGVVPELVRPIRVFLLEGGGEKNITQLKSISRYNSDNMSELLVLFQVKV